MATSSLALPSLHNLNLDVPKTHPRRRATAVRLITGSYDIPFFQSPGPFISNNPNVVVLLIAKSFPTLFDVSKVERKDLFTGTYMPSTELTGGRRVLSYLDPSEPKHAPLKNLMFYMLKSSISRVMPEFEATCNELSGELEAELAQKGKAFFNNAGEQAAFRFLGWAYLETVGK